MLTSFTLGSGIDLKVAFASFGIFCLLVFFHCLGTGTLPLIDRDEPRFAEASREMIQRGDWIVPYFNDAPRFHKPPLFYWAQILSYQLLGEDERGARLPSVLAASFLGLVIFVFGSQLYDKRTGFCAAAVFSLSLQTMLLAKAATTDMVMVLFVTLAAWAGWALYGTEESRHRVLAWSLFYGSLALGFLAKGPVAGLPLIMSLPQKRRGLVIGLLFAASLVGLWGIPALLRTGGEFFSVGIGEHVIGRSVKVMEGHGAVSILFYVLTLPFYFLTVFISFAPWSWFLPGAVAYYARPANRTVKEKYLVSGVVIVFVVFSLIRTKLPHYTFPAFPLLSLLFAHFWSERKKDFRIVRRIAAVTVVVLALAAIIIYPRLAPYSPAGELFNQSRHLLTPQMEFASVGYKEPSLVWSFRKIVNGFHTSLEKSQVAGFMMREGPRFCILPAADFAAIEHRLDPRWEKVRHRGVNLAKGKWVELVLVLKRE
jgi:4-amino-4-deoxy-L-arabinose transferase-like glycosyltransferase